MQNGEYDPYSELSFLPIKPKLWSRMKLWTLILYIAKKTSQLGRLDQISVWDKLIR